MTKRAAPERRRDALRRTLIGAGITETRRRESLVVALYGAVWYRLLLDEPVDDGLISGMIELADRTTTVWL